MIKNILALHRQQSAVREAVDTLPLAVGYFTGSGTVKLCNARMYDLFQKLAGYDLQNLTELHEVFENKKGQYPLERDGNVFIFPNGSAWQYSEDTIQTEDERTYTEIILNNVTDLYEKQQELRLQSAEVKRMYGELKELSDHLQEMVRTQEILNMKAQLHDQMNSGIAAVHSILRQNSTSQENELAIRRFRRAMQVLQEDSASRENELEEFIRDARVSGVQVEIEGKLPATEQLDHLVVRILREACVNAARHADASQLYVTSQQLDDRMILRITNNGRQPQEDIVPKGGLADIRRMVLEVNGTMNIHIRPEYMLEVILPL